MSAPYIVNYVSLLAILICNFTIGYKYGFMPENYLVILLCVSNGIWSYLYSKKPITTNIYITIKDGKIAEGKVIEV